MSEGRLGRGRVLLIVGLVAAVVAAVGYLVDGHGAGRILYYATSSTFLAAMGIGPLVRGARPLWAWMWLGLGGVVLALTGVAHIVKLELGPFDYVDLVYLVGYSCVIAWLACLIHRSDTSGENAALLDAAATPVGTGLALWVLVLAPLTGDDLPSALVWSVYPPLDVVLLALTAHLAMRLGRFDAPLRWFAGSGLLWLIADSGYAILGAMEPNADVPVFEMVYLFAHLGFAVATCHPRIVDLAPPAPAVATRPRRTTALVVFTFSPAVLSTLFPVRGLPDMIVRTTLITVLLGLLFVRLSRTLQALTHAEEASRHRATHDPLTGLPNREALRLGLERRLEDDAAAGRYTAVLFLDCDDFKTVNDTWGHHAGDNLLCDIGARLPERLGPDDLFARHGGDEFVVLSSVDGPEEAERLTDHVRRFFDSPLRLLPDRVHRMTPSLGLAVAHPGEQVGTEHMLRRADLAMYEAKRRGGGGCVVYGRDLGVRAERRLAVGSRLGDAVRSRAFDVRLQPIMGGPGYTRLVGWEALARWHDPELGDVEPEVFVAAAEQLGLICELGRTVLERACQIFADLRRARPGEPLIMSVNVSPAQLLQKDFAGQVTRAMADAGLPSGALRLEVTENMLVAEGPTVDETLRELHEAGVPICLDDFGTGYASLAMLQRLPIECVKLDRSYVTPVGTDPVARRRISAIIELIHSLGIEHVVAEGVETAEQADALSRLGCPFVQGWLYGKAMTAQDALTALTAAPARAGAVGPSA